LGTKTQQPTSLTTPKVHHALQCHQPDEEGPENGSLALHSSLQHFKGQQKTPPAYK